MIHARVAILDPLAGLACPAFLLVALDAMQAPPPSLHLAPALAAEIRLAWVEGAAAGREPCGYLLGEDLGRDGLHVHAVRSGRNVHPQPERAFALAPEEHLAVRREARTAGWRVLGCWHGHLVGEARPSRADAEGLGPLGPHLALIAGQAPEDPPELRAWHLDAGAWTEIALQVR